MNLLIGWFGIGFGSSMKNCDMIIVEQLDSFLSVSDYFSFSSRRPSLDSSLSGSNDIILLGQSVENGLSLIKFKRLLDTADKFDKVLKEEQMDLVWAIGN
jgi:hypothetical protein